MSSPAVTLEKFTLDDAERLIGWIPSQRYLVQWAGPTLSYPLTRKQIAAHLERAAASAGAHKIYRVRAVATGEIVGHAEMTAIDRMNRNCRISRVLVGPPSARGRGLGGAIVRRLLAVAFDELALHRVELGVFDFNEAAIRCYERAGFVREGVRREVTRCGTEFWNSVIMACLRDERSA